MILTQHHCQKNPQAHSYLLQIMVVLPIFLLGCAQGLVGSLAGTLVSGTDSSAISVNFQTVSFPTDAGQGRFSILLENISGDSVLFVLSAKDAGGTTIEQQFPTGNYIIDDSTNTFSGTLRFIGSQTLDVTAVSGFLSLNSLQVGTDENGDTAVGFISATFEIDLQGGGFIAGNFEKSFLE